MALSQGIMAASAAIATPGSLFSSSSAYSARAQGAFSSAALPTLKTRKVFTIQASSVEQPANGGSQDETQSRRSLLGLIATSVAAGVFVKDANAVSEIKLAPPPPLSGGLPGTDNADQARNVDLPLKDRFFIQRLSDTEALERLKVAAKAVADTKPDLDRKAWPYVQNGLRSEASTLFLDIDQLIGSKKTREEKKALLALKGEIKEAIEALDFACRKKDSVKAATYYEKVVSSINDIIPKLG